MEDYGGEKSQTQCINPTIFSDGSLVDLCFQSWPCLEA